HRLELAELRLAVLDLARERLHRVARRCKFVRLLIELRHLLVGRVARLAQRVEPALQLASPLVEAAPRGDQRGNIGIATAKDVVHPGRVKHTGSVPRFCNDRKKLGANLQPNTTAGLTTMARRGSACPWRRSRPVCLCSSGP